MHWAGVIGVQALLKGAVQRMTRTLDGSRRLGHDTPAGEPTPGAHFGRFTVPDRNGNRKSRRVLQIHQLAVRGGDVGESLRSGALPRFLATMDQTSSDLNTGSRGDAYAALQRSSHTTAGVVNLSDRACRQNATPTAPFITLMNWAT